MLKRKWRLAVVAAGSLLIAAGCSVPGDGGDESAPEDQPASEQAAGEEAGPAGEDAGQGQSGPNTDDIPDPVAEVNGTEISKDEFVTVFEGQYQQMAMQSQASGQQVDENQLRQQTAESLVGTELLGQEASNRDIEVSDEEVDESLVEFAETNQVSTDEFIAAMGEQGLDEDDVMTEIEDQLRIEKLIAEEYGEFEASDEEIEAAYQQVQEQQSMMGGQQGGGQELPPLEEVRGQLEEQMKAEEDAQNMQTLVSELREGADVTVHV